MLAKTVLFVGLGAFASAQTFEGFPGSLTCKTDSGGTRSVTISRTEIQNAIVGPRGIKEDDSAANVASGKCATLSGIPLFVNEIPSKGTVGFAYDKGKDTYHFCFGQGAVDDSGYASQCTELE